MELTLSQPIDLEGNAQETLALSTTAAQTAALAGGTYDLWCETDCYIMVGSDASGVTTNNGYLLRAGNTVPVFIRPGKKLGTILSAGSATLSYHRVAA